MTSPDRDISEAIVTGASGFLGSRLVAHLANQGIRVIAVSRRPSALTPGVTPVEADLLEADGPGRALAELSGEPTRAVLFHLAGCAHVGWCEGNPLRAFELNVLMAARVVDASRRAGLRRIVFPSSAHVYSCPSPAPLDEDDEIGGGSVYATYKVAAESVLRGFATSFGMSCDIARLSNVYGAGASVDTVAGRVLQQAHDGGPLSVHTLLPVRDFVFIEDVVEGLIRLAMLGGPPGFRVFNLSTGCGASVGELLETVQRVSGVESRPPQADHQVTSPTPWLVLSNRRLRERTSWVPAYTLEEGIRHSLHQRVAVAP
ncbi:MAG: NAD-dependent epimerase/dehydratase family protein [Gemmatimonadaceae bacterium]